MSDGLERLRAARLIAVLRSESPEAAVNAAVALADAGVRAIELTFTTPGAPEALRAARERLPADALVGAGTIRTSDQLVASVAAGAESRDAAPRRSARPTCARGWTRARWRCALRL